MMTWNKLKMAAMALPLLATALPAMADTVYNGCLMNDYGYQICTNTRVRDSDRNIVGTVQVLDDTYYTASIAYSDSYGYHYTYTAQLDNLTPISVAPTPYPPSPYPPAPYPPSPYPPAPAPAPYPGGDDNRTWVCSTQSNGRHFSVPGHGYSTTRQKVVQSCIDNGFTNPAECNANATCQ